MSAKLVGMARCVIPARVQRAEPMLQTIRITVHIAPLNAPPTAQRAVPAAEARQFFN
jgi:hypothetical protein